jgi:hypothetical protein
LKGGIVSTRLVASLTAVVLLILAPAAHAIGCQQWSRLGPEQKSATIDRMIQNAVTGQGGRSYRVNRGAVGRCMGRYAQQIEYDFDAACADSRTAGMQALNNIFKDYIWSCVR